MSTMPKLMSCKNCQKITQHEVTPIGTDGRSHSLCTVCGTDNQKSYKEKLRLEESRKNFYQDKTFGEAMEFTQNQKNEEE